MQERLEALRKAVAAAKAAIPEATERWRILRTHRHALQHRLKTLEATSHLQQSSLQFHARVFQSPPAPFSKRDAPPSLNVYYCHTHRTVHGRNHCHFIVYHIRMTIYA